MLRPSALSALAVGLLAAAGTAAAQGTPDPKTGAFGGATYGGVTAAPAAPPAAPPVAAPVVEAAPVPPAPTFEAPPPMEVVSQPSIYDRWGIAVSLGGGPEGFASPDNTGTHTGGGWNVRATIGTKSLLGFEASYFGSAQSIDALGLDPNAILVGNGLQGSLRLNLTRQYDVGLFLLGGMAWRHYGLSNVDTNTSDVTDSDNVLEVPIGAGVQYVVRGFLLDARADYRFTRYANMMATASNGDMSRWGVQGNIGYQF
ncbi:MAG TPA: hypothetical protein VFK02_18525 [Kofleriaceae bacterium]|nr:hypothetical protein [Kofleriaceae bacterium]